MKTPSRRAASALTGLALGLSVSLSSLALASAAHAAAPPRAGLDGAGIVNLFTVRPPTGGLTVASSDATDGWLYSAWTTASGTSWTIVATPTIGSNAGNPTVLGTVSVPQNSATTGALADKWKITITGAPDANAAAGHRVTYLLHDEKKTADEYSITYDNGLTYYGVLGGTAAAELPNDAGHNTMHVAGVSEGDVTALIISDRPTDASSKPVYHTVITRNGGGTWTDVAGPDGLVGQNLPAAVLSDNGDLAIASMTQTQNDDLTWTEDMRAAVLPAGSDTWVAPSELGSYNPQDNATKIDAYDLDGPHLRWTGGSTPTLNAYWTITGDDDLSVNQALHSAYSGGSWSTPDALKLTEADGSAYVPVTGSSGLSTIGDVDWYDPTTSTTKKVAALFFNDEYFVYNPDTGNWVLRPSSASVTESPSIDDDVDYSLGSGSNKLLIKAPDTYAPVATEKNGVSANGEHAVFHEVDWADVSDADLTCTATGPNGAVPAADLYTLTNPGLCRFSENSDLSNGTYTFTSTSTDEWGNEATYSHAYTITGHATNGGTGGGTGGGSTTTTGSTTGSTGQGASGPSVPQKASPNLRAHISRKRSRDVVVVKGLSSRVQLQKKAGKKWSTVRVLTLHKHKAKVQIKHTRKPHKYRLVSPSTATYEKSTIAGIRVK